MMQHLNCGSFELPSYNLGLPYGLVGIMRWAAHMYFYLTQALIPLFFTLNINENVEMNEQVKQFGLH